jgi:hypothetical protein
MIQLRFIGQFGNQLFQYCFARIVACRTGLGFTPPDAFLTKNGKPVVWSGTPLFQLARCGGELRRRGADLLIAAGNHYDLDTLGHDVRRVRIRTGYFQRYELYRPYKEQIRTDWLRLQVPLIATDPEAVYVHVRRADYVPGVGNPNDPRRHALATTIDEYAACLKHFDDAKRLVLCTDDPHDPFLHEFHRLGLPFSLSGGTWDQDLLLLLSADNLLICQSTYSWWAGFLGRARKIVCPLSRGTLWWFGATEGQGPTKPDHPNLIVDDEPDRWTWVTQ